MIAQIDPARYTLEEYLALEVKSEERHEYIDGEIIPMTGGTPNHNKIAGNLHTALNVALKRQPYDVYVTDQRLWIPQRRIHTYPDVMVMAQPIAYAEGRRDTLTNPILIAEVLSASTRNYDQGEKFAAYRTIPSFQEYVLIDQSSIHIQHYFKIANHRWTFAEYEATDSLISLQSIGCGVAIADLYDKVELNAVEDEASNALPQPEI